MMKNRFSTNIAGLDRLLDGGLPYKTNILVTGNPGTGKSTFCYQMTKNILEKGVSCLFVTTTDEPKEVIKRINELGINAEKYVEEKELVFIDCYSSKLGKSDGLFKIVDTCDLNTLSLYIDKGLKSIKRYSIMVFDCFSDMLVRNDLERTSKFLGVIGAKIKDRDCSGLFTLVEEMHDEKTNVSIEYLCDGIIELSMKNEKRFMHVKKMEITSHSLKKFEFSIEKEGIALRELREFFEK